MSLDRFCDAPDWVEPHIISADLSEVSVLSWPQIKHLAPVVWLLKHQPVAFHDIAGLHIRHVIVILNGVAVIRQLLHLPFKVHSLVDPHLEGSLVLLKGKMSNEMRCICINLTGVMVLVKVVPGCCDVGTSTKTNWRSCLCGRSRLPSLEVIPPNLFGNF